MQMERGVNLSDSALVTPSAHSTTSCRAAAQIVLPRFTRIWEQDVSLRALIPAIRLVEGGCRAQQRARAQQ